MHRLVHDTGDIVPASEGTIIYFASYLARSVRHCTIRLYLAAVRNLHISCGHSDPLAGKLLLRKVSFVTKGNTGFCVNKLPPALNSFWGKFAENMRKTCITTVTEPQQLYDMLINPLVNISTLCICSEDILDVLYTDHKDEYLENGKTNIFIAALTTAQARLKLYSFLHILQQQVLYFDTDSVIYTHLPDEPELPIGDFLGDLTNELTPGDHIVEFASGGPKNYGYRTHQNKVECKVRGFTLSNLRGHNQPNFDILKQNVIDDIQQPLDDTRTIPVTNPHFFTRDPATKAIRVIPRTKAYTLVFDKRVINPNTFRPYPYGYTPPSTRDPDQAWQSPMQTPDSNSDSCLCELFNGEPCHETHH